MFAQGGDVSHLEDLAKWCLVQLEWISGANPWVARLQRAENNLALEAYCHQWVRAWHHAKRPEGVSGFQKRSSTSPRKGGACAAPFIRS
jgi:hypothetical protein